MLAYAYVEQGKFELREKERPALLDDRDATVTVVALYDGPQTLPLPDMYGKNLTFRTGGVDGCNCAETLALIASGKLDTAPLITRTYPLRDIAAAYDLFANRRDGVIKVAVRMDA